MNAGGAGAGGSSEGGRSSKGGSGGKSSVVEQTSTGGTETGTTVVGGGASSTGGVVGTGGTTATGGSAGSSATGGTTAAQSSVVGTGGQISGGQLIVNAAPPSPWCVGTEYNAVLTASGGGPTFTWTPGPAVPGLTVGTSTTATIPVTGKPTEAGTYPNVVTASDGTNTPGAFALTVSALPTISNSALAVRCLGEKFEEQLLATGGAASEFEWSATLPSDLGITLSPAGVLSGTLKKTGEFNLEFTVKNKITGCVSTKKTLPLVVNGESSTNCPTIKVKGQPSIIPAPGACEAWPYSAEFEVTGGLANPAWIATNVPAGLSFNSETRILSGNPTAGGTITLQVSDFDRKRVIQKDFEIPLRKKCWFGYVSDETGANRLHLFDPLLGVRIQRPVTNSTDLTVADFKFSPDGKFVAYRVKDVSGDYKLWLWQAPGWVAEQEVSFDGSVTHYEWSKDSGVLAAAIKTDDDVLLDGIDVSAVPSQATAGPIQGLRGISSVSAPVDSEFTWFGPTSGGYVAFHSLESPGFPQRSIYYSKYSEANAEFSDWDYTDFSMYDAPFYLYSSSSGLHVAQAVGTVLKFFPNAMDDVALHGNDAISPSGEYTATVNNGQLRMFRSNDASFGASVVPWKAELGCDRLLTWANSPERIACINTNENSVYSFTLDSSNLTLVRENVRDSGAYVSETQVPQKSAFSRNGNWLALATKTHLYFGYFGIGGPAITVTSDSFVEETALEMGFSPDESRLGFQRGSSLFVFEPVGAGKVATALGQVVPSSPSCQNERYSLPTWCGSDRSKQQFVWAPNSDLLAFARGDGTLIVANMRVRPISMIVSIEATTRCVGNCIGGFQFQP